MPYVRDSWWRGREFASLAQMQSEAARWSQEVAGLRHSRALGGGQPLRVFEALEAEALQPLPPRAFELTTWSIGTVGVDAHLKVGKALYSVPWRLIGQRLHARTTGDIVQVFANDGQVVATHVRRLSGRSTDFAHYLLVTWNQTGGLRSSRLDVTTRLGGGLGGGVGGEVAGAGSA